jgi:Ca2+-binding RTX toxin-like protein
MNHATAKSVVESLEGRTLCAATPTAVVVNGMLEVTGTRRAETIEVSVDVVDSTKVNVSITGAATQQFNLVDIAAGVRVNGASGGDVISVLGLSLPCELSGGNGRDTLLSGAGADLLLGGNGRDILMSLAGMDRLNGGNGVDTLDGGDDDDTLDGGRGRDLLTGGLGADLFLGRDKALELIDLTLDDTHTDLSLLDDALGLVDDFLDLFQGLFTP